MPCSVNQSRAISAVEVVEMVKKDSVGRHAELARPMARIHTAFVTNPAPSPAYFFAFTFAHRAF
jgi:hypothetical protein